ncbi:MAG: selenocysteine-specific translation elongation factor [Acidimicrobiia bacterium]
MPVVATAGHVDHGKSALIEALTGRDPDRLEEEKRRGLTIDLGFAWMDLPSGRRVSFVDVPGHRRFIGNMLAGVGPVDAALLVVAADEGWMPQTEEHLAILDALGVESAVVALTKTDRVDRHQVDLLATEIGERVRGSGLAGAQIVPVSAVVGDGLDTLRLALDDVLSDQRTESDQPRPRLWIDRAFSIVGAGTVVTGTLTGGPLRVGEIVSIWPNHPQVRVRGLQSNEAIVEQADPSSRVAVNLAGAEKREVSRGSLLTYPELFLPSRRFLVSLQPARYEAELTDRGAFLLYIGTHSGSARLSILGEELALLDLTAPVWVQSGDRFVIRDSGRQVVVAGGRILDLDPPKRRAACIALGRELLTALDRGSDGIAEVMLGHRGRARLDTLAAYSGGGIPSSGVQGEGEALSPAEASRLAAEAVEAVAAFRTASPLEEGMALGQLAAELELTPGLLRAVLATTELRVEGSLVVGHSRAEELSDLPEWRRIRVALEESALSPPSIKELGLGGQLLRVLTHRGLVVRVSDDFVYLPERIEGLKELLRSLPTPWTVSDFRQQAGISRKHAVPLVEWFDREGVTIRQGDLRRAKG